MESIINKIKEDFTDLDICDLFDNEILDWDYGYDPDEIEEEWSCRYDFYVDVAGGEAENAVCDDLLKRYDLSRNKAYDLGWLDQFEEWLTEYTGINFEV